ncbi:MAG: sulfotransferase domain-containing protein, partial [Actinomycetia bacterium]|nr:sulfotransferase domain-containing protein [Actinomycetes bacterium]
PEGAAALRFAVDRNRYVPLMTRPGLSPRYQRQQAEHLDRLARLYRAIASVSGARVLIDSSKHASYALLLSQIPGIDLRLLHVVRDSRAVAHAWTRTVPRPEAGGVPMPVYGPAKAAVLWDLQNTLIERLRQQHPYIRVRYEDFVEAPKDILLQIALFAGLPDDPSTLGFLDGDTITVSPSHSVAGNPMRFVSGDITITSDHRWSTEMPAGRRRYVSALTLPLHRLYGYQSGLR